MLLRLVLLTVISVNGVSAEESEADEISKFQKLFMQKRIEQLAAVKNILKLDDIKRKTLLDQITSKLFQVETWKEPIDFLSKSCSGSLLWPGGSGESRVCRRIHALHSRSGHREGVSGPGEHLPGQWPPHEAAGWDLRAAEVKLCLGLHLQMGNRILYRDRIPWREFSNFTKSCKPRAGTDWETAQLRQSLQEGKKASQEIWRSSTSEEKRKEEAPKRPQNVSWRTLIVFRLVGVDLPSFCI